MYREESARVLSDSNDDIVLIELVDTNSHFENINVHNFPTLRTLILNSCKLKNIEFNNIEKLKFLDLRKNDLREIPKLSDMELSYLNLSNNDLYGELALFDTLSVNVIDITFNNIDSFDSLFFSFIKDLKLIYVGYNKFQKIPCSIIKELYLKDIILKRYYCWYTSYL